MVRTYKGFTISWDDICSRWAIFEGSKFYSWMDTRRLAKEYIDLLIWTRANVPF